MIRTPNFNCVVCNTPFYRRPSKAHITQCCSHVCRVKRFFPKIPNQTCHHCGKVFYRPKSHTISKSGLQFCSRLCKDTAQSVDGNCPEIRPQHYGDGGYYYRERALKHYSHQCSRCGYSRDVRVLEVHHKDKDRTNNVLSNLEVLCPTCHVEHHIGLW